ncbi:hypothetical protein HRI_004706700 [Hibiscus trionum]|uniref:Uncharacterized protein n=1 Tax=Hibiscus trionum TaxID=183268 RepID=A0A9W7MT25_HIBTR|nr:hypothetical protein HRI_004706700 [Hibiscus trionum]
MAPMGDNVVASNINLEKLLSMKGGKGEGSYADNSQAQALHARSMLPLLKEALDCVHLRSPEVEVPFVVVDLGCSCGGNTIYIVDVIVKHMVKVSHVDKSTAVSPAFESRLCDASTDNPDINVSDAQCLSVFDSYVDKDSSLEKGSGAELVKFEYIGPSRSVSSQLSVSFTSNSLSSTFNSVSNTNFNSDSFSTHPAILESLSHGQDISSSVQVSSPVVNTHDSVPSDLLPITDRALLVSSGPVSSPAELSNLPTSHVAAIASTDLPTSPIATIPSTDFPTSPVAAIPSTGSAACDEYSGEHHNEHSDESSNPAPILHNISKTVAPPSHSMVTSNDFNTLFQLLPPLVKNGGSRTEECLASNGHWSYFAAGVPGSFYRRLFSSRSIYVFHSTFSLHWLSHMSGTVLDKRLTTYNKGRVFIHGASESTANAYRKQFQTDLAEFMRARSIEMMRGGSMFLVYLGRTSLNPTDQGGAGLLFGTHFQDAWDDLFQEIGRALANSCRSVFGVLVDAHIGDKLSEELFLRVASRGTSHAKELLEQLQFYHIVASLSLA